MNLFRASHCGRLLIAAGPAFTKHVRCGDTITEDGIEAVQRASTECAAGSVFPVRRPPG